MSASYVCLSVCLSINLLAFKHFFRPHCGFRMISLRSSLSFAHVLYPNYDFNLTLVFLKANDIESLVSPSRNDRKSLTKFHLIIVFAYC